MVTITRLAPGEYRYATPLGNFGVTRTTAGWTASQWTPESGTVDYGTFATQRELDAAMVELFA